MDPLSDVLALLKPRNTMCGGFDVGGDWSFQFFPHRGIKCYAIVSGQCWLTVDGVADPIRLTAGDGFLLPLGRPFRLASDLDLPPVDYRALYTAPLNGRIARWNGGGEVAGVGGFFGLDGYHAEILLQMLPPVVHLRTDTERAALRWSIEQMMRELRDPQPGSLLVLEHLAQMMLVQALRSLLADGSGSGRGVGWLFALADEQVGPALTLIHAEPAHPWTLEELADRVTMSRSSFARRFRDTVGEAPIEYLTRWRMLLAGDRLATGDEGIGRVARSLGYESESAFSTAFKRVMGCSPRRYARDRREAQGLTRGDSAGGVAVGAGSGTSS